MAWYSGYQHPYQGFFWTWGNEKAHSGIDLPASCGTPMTAILSGTVITAGQYPCYGGQISIRSNFAGVPIVYTYLHGTSHKVKTGDPVIAGELLGYSGAPVSSACGGGCHIHFEVEHGNQAPYTGGPPQNSSANNYPINPVPLLAYAATHKISAGGTPAPPGGSKPGGTSTLTDTTASKDSSTIPACIPPTNIFDVTAWTAYLACVGDNAAKGANSAETAVGTLTGFLGTAWATIGPWIGIRGIKLVAGILMVGIGLFALILPTAAPYIAGGTAIATGNPELALPAANAARSVFKKQGTPTPPPPSRAEGVTGLVGAAATKRQRQVELQRSYTTRNLGSSEYVTAPLQQSTASGPFAQGPSSTPPSQPSGPAPTAYTATNKYGKQTLHVPIMEPDYGKPPAPGVQRMIPYSGPSISDKPAAKPKAPTKLVSQAPTSTTSTVSRASTTVPLKKNKTLVTGMPLTDAEVERYRQSGLETFRSLQPGQSAVGQSTLPVQQNIKAAKRTSKARAKTQKQAPKKKKQAEINQLLASNVPYWERMDQTIADLGLSTPEDE